jgi:aspartate racemase
MSDQHACIGIIGGMSPESTVTYYQTIVRAHREHFGRLDYPRVLIGSIPFEPVRDASHREAWDEIRGLVQAEGEALAAAGADFLLIGANTVHIVVPDLRLPLPLLEVYDAVAGAARAAGHVRLGLTGTRFTMTGGFYADQLQARDLEVVLPADDDMAEIHRIIYEELVSGEVVPASVARFTAMTGRLVEAGADAVLLACTELELLMRGIASPVPLLDTTALHAEAAWRRAVGLEGDVGGAAR